VAVGATGVTPYIEGASGRAAASVWNGRSWTPAPVAAPGPGTATLFSAVTCLKKTDCVAVGETATSGPAVSPTELTGFWNGRSWHLVAPQ
jgi:hypothetical protein